MTNTTNNTQSPIDSGQARWDVRSEILNWANITYRYHRKRQWFFDLCDKVTQSASIVMGLSLFGKTVQDHLPYVGFSIACLGVMALVFTYADRKQCHRELADLSRELAGEIAPIVDAQLTDKLITHWERIRTKIELREPPTLKTLAAKCEWEQACVEGHEDIAKKLKVSPFAQLFMHFF
ncbi:hypothetical protein [Comamonas sediminis]|uniref:SMODS and SLOG-associating 2TM effector domain-containing protein n=1 Tax=Comamonas sediminis TaxID=1783360 RepID=A0ABV4B6G4_9BURK